MIDVATQYEYKGRLFYVSVKPGTKDLMPEYINLERECRVVSIKKEYKKLQEISKQAIYGYFKLIKISLDSEAEAINTFRLSYSLLILASCSSFKAKNSIKLSSRSTYTA